MLLEVRNLKTYFYTDSGVAKSVDGITFDLEKGETLCVVGESGSGKSVTGLSVMGLIDSPGKIEDGQVLFEGQDLLALNRKDLRKIRGKEIAMIFQDPMSSLNPVLRISSQMLEVYKSHADISRKEAAQSAIEMLASVGLPGARSRFRSFPFELSGGMQQRVSIAMALSCKPKLLIADEPTTALDVTVQAQILDLMREISATAGASVILITHDLGVVAEMADKVLVMYAGRVVESARTDTIFTSPGHPYTKGLLRSMPRMDADPKSIEQIGGHPPNPMDLPKGCSFSPRCKFAVDRCLNERPDLAELSDGHRAACFIAGKGK